jgi:protein gp37
MSTTIEWTQRPGTRGETWNPVVGCTKVSQGCKNCYAETVHDRRHKGYLAGKLQNIPQYAKPFRTVQLLPARLTQPLKWREPRTVFVNSMSDLFHAEVPFEYIDQVFAVMALTPQHTYQILTKRPERMAEYFAPKEIDMNRASSLVMAAALEMLPKQEQHLGVMKPWPLPNVWLGTSVEDQATAAARIPHLLRCPAAVRFLSCEPLLGAVDLWPVMEAHMEYRRIHENACFRDPSTPPWGIQWVITGGESGHGARPMHPDWARSLRDQCKAAGVPFFFKQWGAWSPGSALDFDRNIVLLSDGTRLPYQHYEGSLTQDQKDNWNSLHALAMHKSFKAHGDDHMLDGVAHQEWPVVAEQHEPA